MNGNNLKKPECPCHKDNCEEDPHVENVKVDKGNFVPLVHGIHVNVDQETIPMIMNCNPSIPESMGKTSGNFVPMIQGKIDLASSTIVNNPIIPENRPPQCDLNNRKYQAIVAFKNDPEGEIWPSWMKDPILHALGTEAQNDKIAGLCVEVEGMSSLISSEVLPIVSSVVEISSTVDNEVMPLIQSLSVIVQTPATLSTLGVVRSSDKINQISVLNDGTMELNGTTWSRLSQDLLVIIKSQSIVEEIEEIAQNGGEG